MADIGYGQVVGWVDRTIVNPPNDNDNNQELFTMCYQFFNGPMASSSYAELHALNYGNGATGTNFYDENDEFGQNAFAVFRIPSGSNAGGNSIRQHDLYVMMQWADSTSFGTSPGNPGLIAGSTGDGVGFSVAFRADGGDPWGGTSNADGSDTKSDPVWDDGGSKTYVYPISNNAGNTHATSRQNTVRFYDISTNGVNHSLHCMADRDNIWLIFDNSDNLGHDGTMYIGVYEPPSEMSSSIDSPIICWGGVAADDIVTNTDYGTSTGNNAIEGFVHAPTGSRTNDVNAMRVDRYTTVSNSVVYNPNKVFNDNYSSFPPALFASKSPDYGHVGYLVGYPDVFNGLDTWSVNAASSSVVVGLGTAVANPRTLLPWSGSHPRSVFTRAGREFML